MSDQGSKLEASDAELIERAQSGDNAAFGELWRRHYRSAARVARQFTSSIDADDLVSEAYARIYQRVLAGGGPTGAFRPYLYTTIRNLASSWGRANRDVNVDLMEEFEDERIPADPASWALDRTLTARAFRTLPERWQTVLWYTEIEGMDPHEVAPLMGITANGVAALSYRAREGLRAAWLQAHVSDATASGSGSGECQWAIARVGERARHSLTERERTRLDAHLADCAKCSIIADEVEEVGSHLAMILVPILLGGVVGGVVVSQLATPSAALAAELVPAVPAVVSAVGATAGVTATAGAAVVAGGALAGVGTWIGGVALIAVVGGTVALGAGSTSTAGPTAADTASPPAAAASVATGPRVTPPPVTVTPPDTTPIAGSSVARTLTGVTSGVGSAVKGAAGAATSAVNSVVGAATSTLKSVAGSVIPSPVASPIPSLPIVPVAPVSVSATVALQLSGTGTPGATVTAAALGTVWATTTIAANGSWSITIAALPKSAGPLTLTENTSGLLGHLLGSIVPLSVSGNALGWPLTLALDH